MESDASRVLTGGIATLATLAVVVSCLAQPKQAERQLVDTLSRNVPGPVTITSCDDPRTHNPYTCRVRDGNGRFGFATVAVSSASSRSIKPATYSYSWQFPLAADGTVDDTVTLRGLSAAEPAAGQPSAAVLAVLSWSATALGTPLVMPLPACPAAAIGATVTCTGPAQLGVVTVARTAAAVFQVRMRYPMPSGR